MIETGLKGGITTKMDLKAIVIYLDGSVYYGNTIIEKADEAINSFFNDFALTSDNFRVGTIKAVGVIKPKTASVAINAFAITLFGSKPVLLL